MVILVLVFLYQCIEHIPTLGGIEAEHSGGQIEPYQLGVVFLRHFDKLFQRFGRDGFIFGQQLYRPAANVFTVV
ncbi:hypothetical protein D3C86_1991160 [compost metagenome]